MLGESGADSVKVLVKAYHQNKSLPVFDFSDIRPKGARLITSGGKAPGPEPLKDCLHNIQKILDRKEDGSKLKPIEVHHINCYIADAVLAGGIRRCMPSGTRVQVRGHGYLPIEDVEVGMEVSTPYGWKRVKNNFEQGEQQLVEIVHKNGSLHCTPNHKVAVLVNPKEFVWKRADELTSDDRLFFVHNEDDTSEPVRLPEEKYEISPHATTLSDIEIPSLDPEIAWVIGVIQGDGYVYLSDTHGHVSVASNSNDSEHIKRVAAAMSKFGKQAKIKNMETENTTRVQIHSRRLASYFYEHIKQPNTELRVPDFIKSASRSVKIAYVQGIMDADGSVKTRPQIIATTVYGEFARDIQSLLHSVGVVSRISKDIRSEWKDQYRVTLINRKDKTKYNSLLAESKIVTDKVISQTNGQFSDGFPLNFFGSMPTGIVCRDRKQITIDRVLEKVDPNQKYHPMQVLEVKDSRVAETYDIEVEDAHCFVAEGVVVHNSAMISVFNIDDDEMLTCKYGKWYETDPHLARANNSAVIIRHKAEKQDFIDLWEKIEASGSGEPGFFFSNDKDWGLNPCALIN